MGEDEKVGYICLVKDIETSLRNEYCNKCIMKVANLVCLNIAPLLNDFTAPQDYSFRHIDYTLLSYITTWMNLGLNNRVFLFVH